ncbi:MAG: translocation/assembly module TamB [Tannerellaceae bacterium]|nr:translocation/assembly module TamB [Tannerellaceae bacterium]
MSELSGRLGVPVRIDRVEVTWLNRLVLDGVYLEDQRGDVLFEANHIAAGFEFFPLLKGKFVFTTARIFGFTLNLSKETPESELNLQFVIDAFAKQEDNQEKREIDLRFNSILIRRGEFSYHVLSEPVNGGKFDPKHVNIHNLSGNISLKAFNKDSINANIKRLSLDEASGFNLSKLSLNIVGNPDSAHIHNFEIRLPETHLKIGQARIDFTPVDSLSRLVDQAPVALTIEPSQICLRDLAAFVPAFSNFTDIIDLSAEARGYIDDINLNRLTLTYSDKMLFNGKMNLRGITYPEEAYLFGEVSRMYITNEGLEGLVNNFSDKPILLPDPVRQLGSINFTGEISGFFDNLVAYGKLSSSIGTLQTDVLLGSNKEKGIATIIKGEISSSDLEIHRLFEAGNPFGSARFDIHLDATRPVNGYFAGAIRANLANLDYKDYRYENIRLSGRFSHNGFDGQVEVNDPNGVLYANGMFKNQGRNSIFNFQADLQHFRPDQLHLYDTYDSPDISLRLTADFTGNTIDNVAGSLSIDSLTMLTATDGFSIEHLEIEATGHEMDRTLSIHSDVLNGEIKGAYSFKTLIPSILRTFHDYVPALINATAPPQKTDTNNFTMFLSIDNTEAISRTLKLPFTVLKPVHISGQYDNLQNNFRLEATLPSFLIRQNQFENGFLYADNPYGIANLQVRATQFNPKGLRNYLDLKANAHNNEIDTYITWANNKDRLFKADLSLHTLFSEEPNEKGKNDLVTQISVLQSPFVVNDTTWYVNEAQIEVRNKTIDIHNFRIVHENQHILIDGKISENPADTLLLDLNEIELSYIFDILNNPVLQFGGKATGIFHINDLYGSRMLNTDLEVHNFSFNQVDFGRLSLFSEWDDDQQGILLLGSIYKTDSLFTDVNGYIYPVGDKAGLSLHFDANDIDIAFLQPFMEKVATGVKGRGYGNVHLFGPFSELSIEGDAYIKEGGLGIEFLNTYYTFSDSVQMTPGLIQAKDLRIYDKYENGGIVNLEVRHNHFKDIEYDVQLQTYNMLVYDVTERINPEIFGTVYGSGTARIFGNEKIVNLDVNMRSEKNTLVSFNFMTGSKAAEYDFITFVDKSSLHNHTGEPLPADSIRNFTPWQNEEAEIRMNFLVDITPDATIELIMDPIAGDKIEGYGNGRMEVEWGNRQDLRINGGFTIINGRYNFSLQQLFYRNFNIREGSTVTFRGDPFNATLDIEAVYNLYANINDLHTDFSREAGRTNIPVNCVMHIEGMLQNPAISFDLELPGSNEDLVQKVKSYVNTEDMLTRQIVYLLVLNKFYTMDSDYRSNEFSAVASSALSYQLSNILNSITDKVQIGTNIRTGQEGGFTETEVEMLLSSQLLNNRLIFNGNFGYKNNPDQGNIFVGEFDIEYMLTRSGEIRLKFYNHANDMYRYLKQSLTTQGLGVMYRKDFTHISEIFRRRRRLLLPPAGITPVQPEDDPDVAPLLPENEL